MPHQVRMTTRLKLGAFVFLGLAKPRVAIGVPKGFNTAESTKHWYGVSFFSRGPKSLRHGIMWVSSKAVSSKSGEMKP